MNLTDLQNLCKKIREILPDAVIAGGAPRDLYFGARVKDIDVMTGHDLTIRVIERIASAVGGRFDVLEPTDPSGTEEFEYEVHFDDSTPSLNLIDLNPFEFRDPVDNLHDFDFALSQIAVTPSGVVMTPAFMKDELNRTCTYMGDRGREQWRIDSSARRLTRLKTKYPNRSFRGCEGLETLNRSGSV